MRSMLTPSIPTMTIPNQLSCHQFFMRSQPVGIGEELVQLVFKISKLVVQIG